MQHPSLSLAGAVEAGFPQVSPLVCPRLEALKKALHSKGIAYTHERADNFDTHTHYVVLVQAQCSMKQFAEALLASRLLPPLVRIAKGRAQGSKGIELRLQIQR